MSDNLEGAQDALADEAGERSTPTDHFERAGLRSTEDEEEAAPPADQEE